MANKFYQMAAVVKDTVVIEKKSWKQVAINALLVGVAAVLTYFVQDAANIDFGKYQLIIVPVLAAALHYVKEWTKEYYSNR